MKRPTTTLRYIEARRRVMAQRMVIRRGGDWIGALSLASVTKR